MPKEEKPRISASRPRHQGSGAAAQSGVLEAAGNLAAMAPALELGAPGRCSAHLHPFGARYRRREKGVLQWSRIARDAIFGDRCENCHSQAFSSVPDAACLKCHDGPPHPAKVIDMAALIDAPRCAHATSSTAAFRVWPRCAMPTAPGVIPISHITAKAFASKMWPLHTSTSMGIPSFRLPAGPICVRYI